MPPKKENKTKKTKKAGDKEGEPSPQEEIMLLKAQVEALRTQLSE
jgi:hypothetical protein